MARNKMTRPPLQYKEFRVHDHLSLLAWKRQLRGILLTENLWRIINGSYPEPNLENPDERQRYKEMEKWNRLNAQALGWITLTLEDYSRQSVERFEDPTEALRFMFTRFKPLFMTFDEFTGRKKISIDSDGEAVPGTEMSGAVPSTLTDTVQRDNGKTIVERRKENERMSKKSSSTESRTKVMLSRIIGKKSSMERGEDSPNAGLLASNAHTRNGNDGNDLRSPAQDSFASNDHQFSMGDSNIVIPERSMSLGRDEFGGDGQGRRDHPAFLESGMKHERSKIMGQQRYMMHGALQE